MGDMHRQLAHNTSTTINSVRASYISTSSMKEFLESPLSAMDPLKNESNFKDEDQEKPFEANPGFAVR